MFVSHAVCYTLLEDEQLPDMVDTCKMLLRDVSVSSSLRSVALASLWFGWLESDLAAISPKVCVCLQNALYGQRELIASFLQYEEVESSGNVLSRFRKLLEV